MGWWWGNTWNFFRLDDFWILKNVLVKRVCKIYVTIRFNTLANWNEVYRTLLLILCVLKNHYLHLIPFNFHMFLKSFYPRHLWMDKSICLVIKQGINLSIHTYICTNIIFFREKIYSIYLTPLKFCPIIFYSDKIL